MSKFNITGHKEFDFEVLLRSLIKASAWQLKLRACFDPEVCAYDLSMDWTYFGKPVAAGYFLIKDKKIIVFIPDAVNPEKVLHSLVVNKVQEWKRKCERCRLSSAAIVEDCVDEESRIYRHQPVGPADPIETLVKLRLVEEVFGEITNDLTRRIFELRYLEECTHKEIAARVGKSEANVRQIISREKKRLSAIFVPISSTAG